MLLESYPGARLGVGLVGADSGPRNDGRLCYIWFQPHHSLAMWSQASYKWSLSLSVLICKGEIIKSECTSSGRCEDCCCLVAKSCSTLSDPMDHSLQVSSVHGISQGIILEWVAILFSRGSSRVKDQCLLNWQENSLPLSHLSSPFED